MAEQEQDRSEPATDFKLKEARRRGQVVRSLEWNSLAALSALLVLGIAVSTWVIGQTLALARKLLANVADVDLSQLGAYRLGAGLGLNVLYILSPLLVTMVIVAVLSNLLQSGPVFSAHPLKPDFTRLNPVSGLKRLFSMRVLYEGFKACVKLLLFGSVVALTIRALLPDLLGLIWLPAVQYPSVLIQFGSRLLFYLVLAVLAVTLVDLLFVRWDFSRQMRMSRRELREEVRRREGDPHVLGRRREVQQELRKKTASLAKVREADVVITNPLHIAVALKYDRATMQAPLVLSKGAGTLAARIRRLAEKHRITIVREPKLARALYRSADIQGPIPQDTYADVARILTAVYRARAVHDAPERA